MPDLASVQEWALVLASEGIPHDLHRTGDDEWALVVDARFAEPASLALRAYYEENKPVEIVDRGAPYGRTYVAIVAAVALIAFFVVTASGAGPGPWFAAGAADSGAIARGEWWRTITALTLHVDVGHVLSNAAAVAFLGTALFAWFGPGIGLWLTLASGALGNAMNAAVYQSGHSGVGASTAVFGIVGALAGAQFARHRWGPRTGSIWLPVVAGVLLFVLLGTGENTDIMAHLWGFVAGFPLGVAAGRTVSRAPGWRAQSVLVAAAVLVVAAAWWFAISSSGAPWGAG